MSSGLTIPVPEAPALEGVREKLSRARDHFETLNKACGVAIEESTGKPFVKREGDWEVVCIEVGTFPLKPGIISGDLVHNLRSALDHLVWQLVKVSEGQPGSWTAFPAYGKEDDFIRNVKERSKKRGPGPLDGIEKDGPIWALIEHCQPYKNTKLPPWMPDPPDPRKWKARLSLLGILGALSNVDKHRTIHGFSVYPSSNRPINKSLSWNPEAVLIQQKGRESWEPMEGEAELARFRFRPGVEPNVRVTGPLFFEAGFYAEFSPGEGITVLMPSMRVLGEEVEAIVDSFERFFPT
jgi:hypothetical protein